MANLNLNKVILGGRITAEPEIKQTTSGVPVVSFGIAINRKPKKNEDGTRAEAQADFINCVAWRKTAELICTYFHKGSSICIVGQLQSRSWEDANGQKRYATDVNVEEVVFVDSKSDSNGATSQTNYIPSTINGANLNLETVANDEDLPF